MRSGKECKYYDLPRDNKHDCYCNYFKCGIRNACASCFHYEKADCLDEDAKLASIPYTYNAPQHDWKCGYPDITKANYYKR